MVKAALSFEILIFAKGQPDRDGTYDTPFYTRLVD